MIDRGALYLVAATATLAALLWPRASRAAGLPASPSRA